MKYTVTSRVSTIHAISEVRILFCRKPSKEAAAERFAKIFDSDPRWADVKEGWDFDHPGAKRLFTQEAMDTLAKDYSPSGIYQEMFGLLQRDWNAFPHYSFEYAEVWDEHVSQNTLHEMICTAENPATPRDGRGWFGVKTWNTKYSHPDATLTHTDELDSKFMTCPHCQSSWVFESQAVWDKREERRQESIRWLKEWQNNKENLDLAAIIEKQKLEKK